MRGKIHIGIALNLAMVLHFARKILRKVSSEGNRVVPGGPRKYMFYIDSMDSITVLGDASDRLKEIVAGYDELPYRCTFYTADEVFDMMSRKILKKGGISHPCQDECLDGISLAYDGGRSAGEFMDELCMCRTSRR
jgi:hypothetical protein